MSSTSVAGSSSGADGGNRANIWVAASDGDFDRVKELIEAEGLSPTIPDSNTYTPLHASASWGHSEIFRYLVEKGGDVNVTDDDGDTPLYTVETGEMAKLLVDLGADLGHRNKEGQTAAESLEEDFPEVATYLHSLAPEHIQATSVRPPTYPSLPDPDSLPLTIASQENEEQDGELDSATSTLLQKVRSIMLESTEDGTDPDERLREAVKEAVEEQVEKGRRIGESQKELEQEGEAEAEGDRTKKRKVDDEGQQQQYNVGR